MSQQETTAKDQNSNPAAEPGNTPIARTKKKWSGRKIASSQANARKSRGPKTDAGKLKCKTAAAGQIKHGMLAQTVVLNGESQSRFTSILHGFIAAHGPITEPEHAVIHKMVVAYWRQMRTWSVQQTDFNLELARQDPALPIPIRAALASRELKEAHIAIRYETTYDRQFSRALRDLVQLKALRGPTTGLNSLPISFAASTWQEEEPQKEEEAA